MIARWLVAAALILAAQAPAPDESQEPGDRELRERAAEAQRSGNHEEAIRLYGRLQERHPDLPQIPYNMGVSAYRAGDLERAAEYFRQSLSLSRPADLRSRSAYNFGEALRRSGEEGPDPQGALRHLDEAITELGRLLASHREALQRDPRDANARREGELTRRLLGDLQALREKLLSEPQPQQPRPQQKEQEQQEQQEQQQGQPQQQEQGQERQQEQGQDQGEPQQDQRPDGQGQEEEQPPQEPQSPQGQQPGQEQQQGQQREDRGGRSPEQASSASQAQPENAQRPTPMSLEEAQRLLQGVRDRERKRREELARREALRHPPVDRDW